MTSPSTLYPKKVDLTNCDREPIHLLGNIQPHGFLLVFDSKKLRLQRVSENSLISFGIQMETMNTYDIRTVFGQAQGDKLIKHIHSEEVKPLEILLNDLLFIAIIKYVKGLVYIELEPVGDRVASLTQYDLSEMISELSGASSVEDMCTKTAHLIRKQLGYDRVMLYQFDEDWNGEVIAESRSKHKNSWLGLQYPATDIPQQARALFLKQGVRIIKDVDAAAVPLFSHPTASVDPLDLSQCELRAVSPIHIEYLKNMKVGATLTAAIVSDGSLWGLIACHHDTSRFINYYQRLTVKLLTQVFSTQLTLRASNQVLQLINSTSERRALLVNQMSAQWDIHGGLTDHPCTFLNVTEASAGAIFIDDRLSVLGDVPKPREILDMIDWMYENKEGAVYKTQHLGAEFNSGKELSREASGVLCIFLTSHSKECLIWFKPEIVKTVTWGGNPNKAVSEEGERISPRKSFELWKQEQKGRSLPWKDYEVASAIALIESISKIIVSKYDEVKRLNKELQEAYKDLESFSYSVSHDLRSPLRGISGFAQIIKEDYFDSLDEYGKSSVQRIIDASEKMDKLIDDVISFSSLGKGKVRFEKFSMNELISEVIDFLQVSLLYKNAAIVVHSDLTLVYGDKTMIFQVLTNLLNNALKYSQLREKPLIEIGQFTKNKIITYFVKDNGIGFDKKHADRIFGMFNRLVKQSEFKGSGIGLAIARRIIEKHQGKIWAESDLDQGATFYFQLPISQDVAED